MIVWGYNSDRYSDGVEYLYCVSPECHIWKQSLPSFLPIRRSAGSPGHSWPIHMVCFLCVGLRCERQ